MSEHAVETDAWAESPLGYTPPHGRIIMCRGEASCDELYLGEDGRRYYCRRQPGHPASVGHDCPADAEARGTSPGSGHTAEEGE